MRKRKWSTIGLVALLSIQLFTVGCRKPLQGDVIYLKQSLFPLYEKNSMEELNEKVKDAATKINFARYSSDFGPEDLKVVKAEGMPPCVYLGDMPLLYADEECAAGYKMSQEKLANYWSESLKKTIFVQKPREPFPEKINQDVVGEPENPFEFARENRLPVFVHIYADWCSSCVKMEPEIEGASKELGGSVVFVMLNVDDSRSQAYVSKYSFSNAIPQNIFLNTRGEIVKQKLGFMTKQAIIATVKEVGVR